MLNGMATTKKESCDLHTHSTYSDGTFTPEQIIRQAKELSLGAVALTDHNTLAGLPEFMSAASEYDVEAIAGTEITADFNGKEVHVVGLFVKEEKYDVLNEFLENIQLEKDKENFRLYKKLVNAGYDIAFDKVVSAGKKGSVNRVHFANELIRCGYISSVKEAFNGLLSEEYGFYVPTKRTDASKVVSLISSIGALPILAHPFLSLEEDETVDFIEKMKPYGLVGIETNYSKFSPEQTEKARALAKCYELLASGGSDFHGDNKPDISLGTGRGELCVPYAYLDALKKKAR